MTQKYVAEETTVDEALEELGLSREILEQVALAGEAALASCTANDPRIMVGILRWGRMVRALRELLAGSGWVRSELGLLSTVLRGDKKVAIACATGDERTGMSEANPATKYPKGPATAAAIVRNMIQLDMLADLGIDDDAEGDPPDEPTSETATWVLLTSRTESMINVELSLPSEIRADGRVAGWARRLILDPIAIGPTPPTQGPTDDVPDATDVKEVVIDVPRRKA